MDYYVRIPQQMGQALRGRRRSLRLTQKNAAALVGLLPKTVSALELSPERCNVMSLFKLLSALDLELVLRPKNRAGETEFPWSDKSG